MKILEFDTVILGCGPAGFSAGLYASRGAAKTAIVDISMFGGQPSNYLELENYPGFSKIGGYDLMEKFEAHADMFGVQKFPMQEIESVDLISNPKIIKTKEKEFIGRGVSYCAVCDSAFYKDKVVAVVGGGNSAVEEAMYLTKFASKVYLIHRRDELRADKILQQRAFNTEKLEFIFDTVVDEIIGDDLVKSLKLRNVKSGEKSDLNIDGIFPYIGISPNVDYINGQIEQDKSGFIITDSSMKTSIDGVFAVGDVRNTPLRQVITAASDGAVGAVYAVKYLESLKEVTV